MTFRDWQDVEASDPLVLPINGNTYRIPALGHLDAIRIREEMDGIGRGDAPQISNDEFLSMVLGGQLARMRADNVPDKAIVHAATVAHTDALTGRVAAEALWEKGPNPEALAAAIQAVSAGSTISPSTAAAGSSTKRRASTKATTSPVSKPKVSRSSGTTSSTSRS